MVNQLLGSIEVGLVYGLMVLGVYITFRILKIPDLTVDGSITLGMAVTAMITNAGHPILAIFISLLAGIAAGSVTAFFQVKCRIAPILAGIMTMSGLYSINLLIMNNGSPNISILGSDTLFSLVKGATGLSKHPAYILTGVIVCIIVLVIVEFFFTTHTGLCICATGDNEAMVRATSISANKMKWIALALANGCVAMSGSLYCQYYGGADVNVGSGSVVIGFASVIIGETICIKKNLPVGLVSAIIGSVVYNLITTAAIQTNLLPAYFLKFVSILIIAIALSAGPVKDALAAYHNKMRRLKEDA